MSILDFDILLVALLAQPLMILSLVFSTMRLMLLINSPDKTFKSYFVPCLKSIALTVGLGLIVPLRLSEGIKPIT